MVGGYDFHTNKFNNATQGLRQTGSSYKPFIYTAAVEEGMTPDTIVSGAPIKRGGWQPHNYDGSLGNPNVPMKVALLKSLNISAVHLIEQVGIQAGRADGQAVRHHESDGAEFAIGLGSDRGVAARDGRGLFDIPE